jgi:hypothetical protein
MIFFVNLINLCLRYRRNRSTYLAVAVFIESQYEQLPRNAFILRFHQLHLLEARDRRCNRTSFLRRQK